MFSDPILIIASAVAVGVLLASAASHKLRAPMRFARQVEDYGLLPAGLVGPVARTLPVVEGAVAFALLVPASRHVAALAATALILLYAGAIGINLWRGRRDMDCGCSGPGQMQPLRPVLLLRNAIIAALALIAACAPQAREMGVFDAFVILAASAVALFLYAAADGLLANHPRLLKLIGR
ncbi:methylamine utilization protein MauE [Pseudomonas sp. ZM23]|uniref:Methylamine utilization protein MauE n=1 Tax=Pseudomonas triclosanedens TaxID=2961893 RepID=A0ABY7A7U6_9PSED|nr:MauE/DoxX family redox-associated membrane protein [Pseudomonas triclosanedens]MCP8466422.1 methylamine utilization protein MauE [Pseudomonas triclosanedens]MCP8473176.1 methylamine utilization protein MauE [Pseudomonas triclosanedens]MCP8479053.1 methylamine utilization protein MauE [Pseudomonas triclosanedens]WAI52164.1 methylamine utilization protein MauE [Pseudomonas triclosanedens]